MSIYKDFYDNIIPEKDNEKFTDSIIKAEKPKMKLKPKKFAAMGVAAATAVAVTITGSANGWDLNSIIHNWFGGGEDIISKNVTDVNAENVKDNFDALDFEIAGALSDGSIAVIFINITRTDGKNFDGAEYHILDANGEPYYYIDSTAATDTPDTRFSAYAETVVSVEPQDIYIDGELFETRVYTEKAYPQVKQFIVNDGNPTDNKLTMALCFNKDDILSSQPYQKDKNGLYTIPTEYETSMDSIYLSLSDLTTSKLTYERKNEKTTYASEYITDTVKGSWSADISFSFMECEKNTITPNETVTLEFYNHADTADNLRHEMLDFTLTELTISPVCVSFCLEAPLYDEVMYQFIYDMGEVILKDGTVIKFGDSNSSPYFITENGGEVPTEIANIAPYYERGDKWLIEDKFMLETPIDIDEVDYVKIGERIFEF